MDFNRSRNPAFDFGAALANFATGRNREKISNDQLASNADAFLKIQKANSFSNGGGLPPSVKKSIADSVFLGVDVNNPSDIQNRMDAFKKITGGRNFAGNNQSSPLPATGLPTPDLPALAGAEEPGNGFVDRTKQLISSLLGDAGENLRHVPGFAREQFGKTADIVGDVAGELGDKFSDLDLAQTFKDEGFPSLQSPSAIARELVPLNQNTQQVETGPGGVFDDFLQRVKALNVGQGVPQPQGNLTDKDRALFREIPNAVIDEEGFYFVPNSSFPNGKQFVRDANEQKVRASNAR